MDNYASRLAEELFGQLPESLAVVDDQQYAGYEAVAHELARPWNWELQIHTAPSRKKPAEQPQEQLGIDGYTRHHPSV